MSSPQYNKGYGAERELVKMLREVPGFEDATRNYADKVEGLGVDVTAGNMLIQVKRYKGSVPISKYDEIKRDGGIKALVSKSNYKPWMITLSLDDFITIANDVGALFGEP